MRRMFAHVLRAVCYTSRMDSFSPVDRFAKFADRLRFKNLFILITALFLLDLLLPDMIPMLDEIVLALLAVFLGNLKKKTSGSKAGTVIEGEIIGDDEAK